MEMTDSFGNGGLTPGAIHRVAWTRGKGCADIADRLAGGTALKVDGDLGRSCIRERIETLVSRKLTGFDLVPVVVPHDVDVSAVERVTAAVGDGPHSPFAVSVAARLGVTMGIPVAAVSVHDPESDSPDSGERLAEIAQRHPNVETHVVEGGSAVALVEGLDEATLLVVGAPGGSWIQRQVFGPGHRLQVAAPAGTLTVRSAPTRCFHVAVDEPGAILGPEMSVADALHIVRHPVVSIADHGKLVGMVDRDALAQSSPDARLGDVMRPPISVEAVDDVATVASVRGRFGDGPLPVVDGADRIIGVIPGSHGI